MNQKKTVTTPEEYASNGGLCCPCCNSDQIEGESIEVDAGVAWQDMSCLECNATWTDNYDLVSYTKLEKGT